MKILGIDPGYAITGYGLLEVSKDKKTTIAFGAITTNSSTLFSKRLLEIYTDVNSIIEKYSPDILAIEKLFFTTNHKTAIDVAEARGVILIAAEAHSLKIFEYTPLQVKSAVTGYGKATKKQVQEMTKNILKLSVIPKPDDTADSLAVALCCANSIRYNMA